MIVRKLLGIAGIAAFAVASLAGCSGEINISVDTKQHAMNALCSTGDALLNQLSAGGAITKTAAGLIADNADDEKIVTIATKVKNGDQDEKLIKELKQYITNQC